MTMKSQNTIIIIIIVILHKLMFVHQLILFLIKATPTPK